MAGHAKTLNVRQQAFAENIALKGMPISDAAKAAGYKDSTRHTPGRLAKQPIVQTEINRLRTIARASMLLDAETWQRQLLEQYQAALNDGDRASAVRLFELWGKHLGLLDAKRDDGSARAAEVLATLASLMRPALPETPDKPRTIEARLLPPAQ